ncbi:MAG: helix-turn-helix domain-containing protein [Blastocatellia bacterium]|nr:helix-turn-helix domain-containing protein [Blastocatellia bacterium]
MKKKQERDREHAIKSYLKGESITAIARKLGYSRPWVYKWVERYQASSAGHEWQEDEPRCPHSNPRQMPGEVVEAVKLARLHLYNQGLFCGAQAISWELETMQVSPLPSLRTISRIVQREGLTHRRTGRYEPKGKRYPQLSGQHANDVHQSDYVGPCYLSGPLRFYSMNSVDLATGRCAVTPVLNKAAQSAIDAFWSNWWRLGIPKHQQVDNELVFYGSHRHPRGMGCLIRLCLANGVEPWFIPMAEPWRNGVVEKFNDHYRGGFLRRVVMRGVDDLERESLLFEQKHNTRYRYTKLRGRTPQMALEQQKQQLRLPASPTAPKHPLPKPESGCYHLVRFIRSHAVLDIFGEKFRVPPEAVYEYLIATIDVAAQKLRVTMNEVVIDEHDYELR